MQILVEIVFEEQVDGRNSGGCQKYVFGYVVDVYFGERDEGPVADEKYDEQVHLREKPSSRPMVNTATEQGMTVVVIIGNSMPRTHDSKG